MNQTATTWQDPERDKQLRELISRNLSSSKIGDIMGLSRNAIIGRAHRLGLKCGNGKHRTTKPRAPALPKPPKEEPSVVVAFNVTRAIRARMLVEEVLEPPTTVVIDGFRHLTLMELQDADCRFPTGRGSGIRFCGRCKVDGLPYCAPHARMAYAASNDRKGHTKSAHSTTGQFA